MQTTHWDMLAVYGNSHTGPRETGLFSQVVGFPENCRGDVPSRKRLTVKAKPEQPSKREVKFCCSHPRADRAAQVDFKTRIGPPRKWFLNILVFWPQEKESYELGPRSQEFMQMRRMVLLGMSLANLLVERRV